MTPFSVWAKSAYAAYGVGAAVIALLTAAMLVTRKAESLASVPAEVDSVKVHLEAHMAEARGTNARLDKLLCVETHFTAQEKVACLNLP